MKSCPFPPVFLYVCLLLTAAWLLIMPAAVIAATGTANCGGGQVVTCEAYRCDCTDNVGCTGYDSNGNIVSSQTRQCSSDYQMEENGR